MKRLVLICMIAAVLVSCSSNVTNRDPTFYATNNVPEGWIADFSYNEDLDTYIRRHAARAFAANKQPAIYLFSDSSWLCEETRRDAKSEYFQTVLHDKYIIMLNHEYLDLALDRITGMDADQVGAPSTFVAIAANGSALGPGNFTTTITRSRYDRRQSLKGYFDRMKERTQQ